MSPASIGLDALIPIALATVRVGLALSITPLGHETSAGKRFIVPLSLAIALCVPTPALDGATPLSVGLLAIKEAFLGAGLGFVLSRVFFVVSAAGAILDQQAGYTVGSTFNPMFSATIGPIETIFTALLTLMLVDGHGSFDIARALMATYDLWPVTQWLPPGRLSFEGFVTHLMSDHAQAMIEIAFRIAAPMSALLLLADISTAIAARYAQQLNPFSVSLAIKAAVAAAIIGVLLRAQAGQWLHLLRRLMVAT